MCLCVCVCGGREDADIVTIIMVTTCDKFLQLSGQRGSWCHSYIIPWAQQMKGEAHPSAFALLRKRYSLSTGLTERVYQSSAAHWDLNLGTYAPKLSDSRKNLHRLCSYNVPNFSRICSIPCSLEDVFFFFFSFFFFNKCCPKCSVLESWSCL